MAVYKSPYEYMPFADRAAYFYESYDALKTRIHQNRVAVIEFESSYMAEACTKFIGQFNALPGLRFIRSFNCGKYVALIDVRKMKGDAKWNYR